MDNDLVFYFERLQLMAFFAGYPIIYALVQFLAGELHKRSNAFVSNLARLIPFAYALTGTLFLGMVLKNMYPNYSMSDFAGQFQNPYLKIWGLLSVLFWIPAFSKKAIFSLFHSLVFFFFLLRDLYLHTISHIDSEVIKNDMKIYTDSLLLNGSTLALVVLVYYVLNLIRDNKKPSLSAK